MTFRTAIVVILSLVCGLSAAAGVNLMRNRGQERPTEIETKPVVVAVVDISRGMTVSDEHVTIKQYESDSVPAGAIATIEEVRDRAAIIPIFKDEPLLGRKLAGLDAGRGMAPLIPEGMRAFTIHTPTMASGVAGFVLPGNKVDILLTVTRSSRDGTGGGSTNTLLQNVEVMAVDQRLNAPAENKVDPKRLRSVTLLVTPDQAAKLSLAQTKGTLHLSLRNDGDDAPALTRPVTLTEIRYLEQGPVNGSDETTQAVVNGTPNSPPIRVRTLRGRVGGSVYIER